MNEYESIKKLLIEAGYTKVTEDILIDGDYFHNFYNPVTKEGINLSFEKY